MRLRSIDIPNTWYTFTISRRVLSTTTEYGFYVDGTGKFLAGNTSGNYMNYDGSTLTVAGTINIVAGDLAGVSAASISASINTARRKQQNKKT